MGRGLASGGAKGAGYAPRRPLESALHRGVSEGLPLLVAQAEEHGGVPGFVLRAVQRYLTCGDLSRGFVLVKCDSCELEMKVAFSCKERSVCPSCSARRAALGAAHLVDHVLPAVTWRQWTLAFPRSLRVALLKDERLLSKVLGAFVRTVFAFQRLRARQLGFVRPLTGAVVFIQNFTGALLVHPHFHALFPDGVFEGKDVAFAPLPPPEDDDVERLLRRVAVRTMKLANEHFPDGLPYAEDERDVLLAASSRNHGATIGTREESRGSRATGGLSGRFAGYSPFLRRITVPPRPTRNSTMLISCASDRPSIRRGFSLIHSIANRKREASIR